MGFINEILSEAKDQIFGRPKKKGKQAVYERREKYQAELRKQQRQADEEYSEAVTSSWRD